MYRRTQNRVCKNKNKRIDHVSYRNEAFILIISGESSYVRKNSARNETKKKYIYMYIQS